MKNNYHDVLFIGPEFFGYYKDICTEIVNQGSKVTFISDQIKQSFFNKLLKKVFPLFYKKRSLLRIRKECNKIKSITFDTILLILCLDFDTDFVQMIKSFFPRARMIYYTWDSVSTYPNILNLFSLFDKVFTFDKVESLKYNISFLPLFFVDRNISNQKKYDCSSVMSYYPNKDYNLRQILNVLPSHLKCNFHFYVKNETTFLFFKFKYKNKISFSKNELKFFSLSRKSTYDLFKESRSVIDSPIKGQNGLTMRTFEVLSCNTKLITTNEQIKEFDFYCEDNIFIVNADTNIIPKSFFEKPFNEKYSLGEKYSLENFVRILLGL